MEGLWKTSSPQQGVTHSTSWGSQLRLGPRDVPALEEPYAHTLRMGTPRGVFTPRTSA